MTPSQIWPIPQQVTWRDEALPLSPRGAGSPGPGERDEGRAGPALCGYGRG